MSKPKIRVYDPAELVELLRSEARPGFYRKAKERGDREPEGHDPGTPPPEPPSGPSAA